MLKLHVHAELDQPFRRRVLGEIRAAHLVALVHQHFGDAAHPGAADADEMDTPDLVLHFAISIQRCATMRAASGLPRARAFFAISSSFGRSSFSISCASFPGVSSRCGRSNAAP